MKGAPFKPNSIKCTRYSVQKPPLRIRDGFFIAGGNLTPSRVEMAFRARSNRERSKSLRTQPPGIECAD